MDGARLMAAERRAVIFGAGGFGVELHALLAGERFATLGFIASKSETNLPAAYLGGDGAIAEIPADAHLFVAIGDPAARRRVFDRIARAGRTPATFVHPAAYVAPTATIGNGAIVYPNTTVHGGAKLGAGVVVNSNVSVGHECDIGAFCSLNPGVALGGRMTMAPGTYVGIGATILDQIDICADVVIGAGATVTASIGQPGTYVGTPARPLKAA
jgi:UDP-perosamine 4-acetyltransferase